MCQCSEPGFCPLHNMIKDRGLWQKCQEGKTVAVGEKLIQPPAVMERAKNFAVAVVKHVWSGMREVNAIDLQTRISACESCEHFDGVKRDCRVCGCPVDIKTKWASESCPLSEPRWKATNQGVGCKSCGK